MDGASPMFTSKKEDSGWGTGLLFGGITLVLVILAFFFLNYFQVLSLSELYPKALGWLPQAGTKQAAKPRTVAQKPDNCAKTSPLFLSQTATIQGKILEAKGTTLTVEDKNGQKGDFALATDYSILIYKEGEKTGKTTTDLNQLDPKREALIILQLENNDFKVVSVSYLPAKQ